MKHIQLIVVKFLATLVLLYMVLGFGYGVTFGNVVLITLVVGTLAYLIGDLLILPRTNNTVATIADFAIAFVVVFLMTDFLTVGGNILTASFISAIALGVFEVFYHQYVAEALDFTESEPSPIRGMEYSTETSDELSPYYEDLEDDFDD